MNNNFDTNSIEFLKAALTASRRDNELLSEQNEELLSALGIYAVYDRDTKLPRNEAAKAICNVKGGA